MVRERERMEPGGNPGGFTGPGRHPRSLWGGPRIPSLRTETRRGANSEEKELLPPNTPFVLERAPEQHSMCLMGTAWRNAITGEIHMSGPVFGNVPDFSVVDLWSREGVYGPLTGLAEDPYLFRPVPMKYRTWMYHEMYLNRHVIKSKDEYAMLKEVLSQFCIDVGGGSRYSPLMWYAPAGFACVLAQDNNLAHAAVLLLFFIFGIARGMNSMKLYRYARPTTLLLRVGFMALVILRMDFEDAARMFGYLLVLACCVVDLLWGDLQLLTSFRLHCHYEVLRIFPNRVALCRRVGGSYSTASDYKKPVHQDVSGIGNWEQTFILIADIYGILFELRPVTAKDWRALWELHRAEFEDEVDTRPVFVGIDIFWEEEPTANEVRGLVDLQDLLGPKRRQQEGMLFNKSSPLKEMHASEDRDRVNNQFVPAPNANDVKETDL